MAAIITTYGWIVFSVLDKAVHPGYNQSRRLPRLQENVRQQGWALLSGSAPWSQRLAIWQVSKAMQRQLATHLSSPSSPSSFCGLSTSAPWDGEDPSGLLHYLRLSPFTAHHRDVVVPHQHLVQPPMLVVSGKQDGFLPTQKNDQQF